MKAHLYVLNGLGILCGVIAIVALAIGIITGTPGTTEAAAFVGGLGAVTLLTIISINSFRTNRTYLEEYRELLLFLGALTLLGVFSQLSPFSGTVVEKGGLWLLGTSIICLAVAITAYAKLKAKQKRTHLKSE